MDAADPLVQTKLSAPPSSKRLVARPRIEEQIREAVDDPAVRLILVSAPAGSGKSIVGTPSFGESSDAIDRQLPDSNEFTMSMEVYTDLDGTNFEAVGIPVDVESAFDTSIDVAVDRNTTPSDD